MVRPVSKQDAEKVALRLGVKTMRQLELGRPAGPTGCAEMKHDGDPLRRPAGGLLETFERLLAALGQLAEEARRVGDDGVRGWAALASLDAVDLGEQLGMLFDDDAARRRAVIQARIAGLDQRT
jgi:hypothetical protein